MRQIVQAVPDVEQLLSLEPEELGAKLLFILRQPDVLRDLGNGLVSLDLCLHEVWDPNVRGAPQYPLKRKDEIELAITEAWAWLNAQGLLIPASGINGNNGFRVFSRRARRFATEEDFRKFAAARTLPRDILHPKIAQPVWMAFMRGEFDVAVFQAFKAVEVSVRDASGMTSLLGTELMRKAFDPKGGPLTDLTADGGERQSRADLFAGAIGSFKNPHSHRDVDLDDANEALEAILLANHLLRIVDARRAFLTL